MKGQEIIQRIKKYFKSAEISYDITAEDYFFLNMSKPQETILN